MELDDFGGSRGLDNVFVGFLEVVWCKYLKVGCLSLGVPQKHDTAAALYGEVGRGDGDCGARGAVF